MSRITCTDCDTPTDEIDGYGARRCLDCQDEHDPPDPAEYVIHGSYGDVVCSPTGAVLRIENRTSDAYDDILRFDVGEYAEHFGAMEPHTDILLIGYWLTDGSYEPPEPRARENVAP